MVWLLPVLLAPFVGSFLGVLIARLPQGRSIGWTRSACESCNRVLSPRDLVPIVSFLALRGRCRTCGTAIAPVHLQVELAATLVALLVAIWAALGGEGDAAAWIACGLGWTLLALAWIDLRHLLLPDVLTLPLVLAGLAATWWLDPSATVDHALGAMLGYLLLRGVELGYRALRGRDGLGQGDAKLMAAAGAWVGWQGLPFVLVAAALCGIVLAVAMHLARRDADQRIGDAPIPFGPCIALALWGVWLTLPI